ncbi:hypothetical protein SETIT_4G157300v2 [Setaria italica]|uniref:Uncharacterized protein n=1 Tax=Setaria italica TaxID=4555 RepID=K3Y4H2_SETIT|nr:hypothetical protein SETIT_4G157300v2 [Setaria italica]
MHIPPPDCERELCWRGARRAHGGARTCGGPSESRAWRRMMPDLGKKLARVAAGSP